MRYLTAAAALAFLCGASVRSDQPAKPKLSVTDAATKISVDVNDTNRVLIARDADGKKRWEVDVIAKAGAPTIGLPMIRALMIEKGNVRAIYGKHSFADFDLRTGKLVGAGSD